MESKESRSDSHSSNIHSSSMATTFRQKSRRRTSAGTATKSRCSTQPRPNATIHAPPLDYSFLSLGTMQDAFLEVPRVSRRLSRPKKIHGRYRTASLCMSNNALVDVDGLKVVVDRMFETPQALAWLDLSFNMLYEIFEELVKFPNLQILYLHGNVIENILQVERLYNLSNLHTLTLHGNPLESEPGYRHIVIHILPQLRNLDFSQVIKSDRVIAMTCGKQAYKALVIASMMKRSPSVVETPVVVPIASSTSN